MYYEEISWRCDGHEFSIGLDRAGTGPTVLLLPALSSISTRREIQPLQARLAQSFSTLSVDWPGFGELPKPRVDWRPEIYEQFLNHLLTQIVPRPYGIVAAGHAAGYVVKNFARYAHAAGRLVLLSPTWRGPLPTMMGGDRALFPRIVRAFDLPILGALLYGLNVNRFVIGMMARGHVYADPAWLKGSRMEAKYAVTRTPGARYSSVRFVTGRLDPFQTRNEQINAVQQITVPMFNVFSDTAPEKSRLEMESLAEMENVQTVRLSQGKLSFYEEFPDEAGEAINAFLIASPPG
ncbi:MAG: alpha/beta hydrolase [Proteobacteria bacterium]|jgi:pimeloyl-ACP methyl ester carboxylesterase|nr:alpha/beta hydrolase [Pseudomonadota bacterium]